METSFFEFNIVELLSLLGLFQSIYIIVHLFTQAKSFRQIFIPIVFFFVLAVAFFMNIADRHWDEGFLYFTQIKWFLWAAIPSFSTLFIVQILRITKKPPFYLWIFPLLLGLFIFIPTFVGYEIYDDALFFEISALILGAINLLMIWIFRSDLTQISKKQNGRERFWLIIALILMNIGLLSLYFLLFGQTINNFSYTLSQTIFGLGFVYLGTTSLFRIYPYIVELKTLKIHNELSDDELNIAYEIEKLLDIEKMYQEPGYNRGSLARELSISESQLSRIVGQFFDKTVPQLLHEFRVNDAKNLLIETNADIATITYEFGFNSVATFNRVFKEFTGKSPTEFRKETRTDI